MYLDPKEVPAFWLVWMPAALVAESLDQTFRGPVPGALVLGLPGLGVPDPPDAGRASFCGAGPIRGATLFGAGIADRALSGGRLPTAAGTLPTGHTLGGLPA